MAGRPARVIAKVLLIVLFVPVYIHGVSLLKHSIARGITLYGCTDGLSFATDSYMAAHGDSHYAFGLIHYLKSELDSGLCDIGGQEELLLTMTEKHSHMKEDYISALVEDILDPETGELGRGILIANLERITGESFGYYEEYDDGAHTFPRYRVRPQEATEKVAAWRARQLRERASTVAAPAAEHGAQPARDADFMVADK